MSKMARRYSNPPVIKSRQVLPTAASAAVAAPKATEAAGTNNIPVTTTVIDVGEAKV